MVWPVLTLLSSRCPAPSVTRVRAEFGRALRPPYATLSTVAANGAFMSLAWFFLPRGVRTILFTLHGTLAFALVLAAWMYSDVPADQCARP